MPLARRQLRLFLLREYALQLSVSWGKIPWCAVPEMYLAALFVDVGFSMSAIEAAHSGLWTEAIHLVISEGHQLNDSLDKVVAWTCLFPHPALDPTFVFTHCPQSRKYLTEATVILSAIGNASLLSSLLDQFPEADLTFCGDLAIRCAASFGHADVVRVLLKLGGGRVNTFAWEDEAWREAIHNGHTDVVRLFLETQPLERGAREDEALRVAASKGHTEIVVMLLENGYVMDPSSRNNEALRYAAAKGHSEIVEALLATGRVDPAANDNEPLRSAVYCGRKRVVEILLATGKCTFKTKKGGALRLAASRRKNREVLKVLLKYGLMDRRALGLQRI
ncbi:hypothetical protein HDU67_005905 [Dinochytrium kinnereticum]|nr:hypothetical protein HDU67_005905 [Dinochytrium kinnereticum]